MFLNPSASGTDTGTLLFINQDDTTGVSALGIDSESSNDYALEIRHRGDVTTTTAAGIFVEAEDGAGAMYLHRDQDAATTDGTLALIHEDGAADTTVLHVINEGAGNSLVVYDAAADSTPFVINGSGQVGIGRTTPTANLHIDAGSNPATITLGATNGEINTPETLLFNIDSDNNSSSQAFEFGTNRTGLTGGLTLMQIFEDGDVFMSGDLTVSGNDITMATNTAGYILLSDGTSFSPDGLSGDGTLSATGTFTITANAVTLATDTTGDFVQRIVAGDGIDSTGASTGENIQHTLSVDLKTVAEDAVGTTNSVSGLEFESAELTLLQGCSDGQILKWEEDDDTWHCQTDGGTTTTLQGAYDNDVDGGNATISLTADDESIVFLNPSASGTDTGTLLFINQDDTTGVSALGIDSESADDYALEIRHRGDTSTTAAAGIFVEAEDGAGAMYLHRDQAAATTDGTLVFIHEDGAADTAVVEIQNDGTGTALAIDQNGNALGLQILTDTTSDVGLQIFADSLTTGRIAELFSNSADASSRQLVVIANSNSAATGAIPLVIINNSTGIDLVVRNSDTGATGAEINLDKDSGTPAVNDVVASITMQGNDSGAADQIYAQIDTLIDTPTAGSERGDVAFSAARNGTVTEVMRLDASGGVGIGTTTVTATLTVDGTVLIENTTSDISFRVNDVAGDTTPFVIDSLGNVGIGTTTTTTASLTVMGSTFIQNTGSGNSLVVFDQANDTTPFVVTNDGTMGIGTATPGAPLQIAKGGGGSGFVNLLKLGSTLTDSSSIKSRFAYSDGGNDDRRSFWTFNYDMAASSKDVGTEGALRIDYLVSTAACSTQCGVLNFDAMRAADTSFTTVLTIAQETVSVGIGDETPDAKLDVFGSMIAEASTVADPALTVYGTLIGSTAVSIDGTMILIDGGVDFGSADSLEIPNATSLTVDGTGELYLETDQDGIVLQAGSGVAGQIPSNTDVQVPLVFQKSITMVEPDLIQSVTGTVAFFTVDSFNYPTGIVVTATRIITSNNSTDVISIEYWDDPDTATASKTTIDTLDIGTCGGADDDDCRDTAPSSGTVPTNRFIMIDLDDTGPTDLEWMQITVWFYVPD
ncbi:MAG TPA: hypothetical protein VI749_04500 [Candidatus Omnitrophota bacterium]|nr:hypothetical protein [Candidatus Omnitrophota bacterium]